MSERSSTGWQALTAVLARRDFALLWAGQATSQLGSQFHSIASAWLVLKLTGNPLGLGGALALAGIANAIATLAGGVLADRLTPRRLMLLTDAVRLLLSTALAIQVLTGTLEVWMLYVYSLLGGLAAGAFSPAAMSIAPRLLPPDRLQSGNSLLQGTSQLIGILGPAAAGALIALLPVETVGIGLAMALDALTFAVSIGTLWAMRSEGLSLIAEVREPLGGSLLAGVRYVAHDPALRLMFILLALGNLSFAGPILVGVPFLADTRLPEGAAAYGLVLSGYAAGNLAGIVLSGVTRLSERGMRTFLPTMFVVFALGIAALAWINSTWVAALDLLILGVLNGYLGILLFTGLQRNTPASMMGRLMSLVLVASVALTPLSQAAAGALLTWYEPAVFVASAACLLICALLVAVPSSSRLVSRDLVGRPVSQAR